MHAQTRTNRRGLAAVALALVATVARLTPRTRRDLRHPLPIVRRAWINPAPDVAVMHSAPGACALPPGQVCPDCHPRPSCFPKATV